MSDDSLVAMYVGLYVLWLSSCARGQVVEPEPPTPIDHVHSGALEALGDGLGFLVGRNGVGGLDAVLGRQDDRDAQLLEGILHDLDLGGVRVGAVEDRDLLALERAVLLERGEQQRVEVRVRRDESEVRCRAGRQRSRQRSRDHRRVVGLLVAVREHRRDGDEDVVVLGELRCTTTWHRPAPTGSSRPC